METMVLVSCEYKFKAELSLCKVFQQINAYFNIMLNFPKL